MSWNCDGPHYMVPALTVKILGGRGALQEYLWY